MCRPTPAVLAIAGIEPVEIHLVHRVEHEPGQMVLRQPLRNGHRQQIQLITIPDEEVPAHDPILVNRPDQRVDLTPAPPAPTTVHPEVRATGSDATRIVFGSEHLRGGCMPPPAAGPCRLLERRARLHRGRVGASRSWSGGAGGQASMNRATLGRAWSLVSMCRRTAVRVRGPSSSSLQWRCPAPSRPDPSIGSPGAFGRPGRTVRRLNPRPCRNGTRHRARRRRGRRRPYTVPPWPRPSRDARRGRSRAAAREARSSTVANYSLPSPVGISVRSPHPALIDRSAEKSPLDGSSDFRVG